MTRTLKYGFLSLVGFLGLVIGILIGLLFGIIGMTIFKDLVSPLSVEQLTMLTTSIMALASVILVIITGFYAHSTYKILKEQEKSRQISYIKDQLEKLYYPLKNILNGTSEMEIPSIVPFMYLGTEELNEAINKYLVVEYDPDRLTAIEQADICYELELKVNQDIYDFRNKLLDLYGLKNHFEQRFGIV